MVAPRGGGRAPALRREDGDEDARYGAGRRGDEMPDWVSNKMRRIEKIREAKKALEEEPHCLTAGDKPPPYGNHEARSKGRGEEREPGTAGPEELHGLPEPHHEGRRWLRPGL